MKKFLSMILLGILILGIGATFLTKPVFAEPDDEDPGAYVRVQLSPSVSGISVGISMLSAGSVKVEDGSWFWGWGSSASTTTDGSGLAQFRVWRLLGFTADISITVNGAPSENIYGMSLNVVLWAPTHTFTWYYLTVSSAHNAPTPASGWFYAGTAITASVTSPADQSGGIRYGCTGWTGTGSVPSSGTGTSVAFTINSASSITWNWIAQYYITFAQSGVGSDFSGTVMTIDGTDYDGDGASFWFDDTSSHTFAFNCPLVVTPDVKRYCWVSTAGLSTLQTDTITVATSGSVTGNYKTQYYLTVKTNPEGLCPAPTPPSGWFDECSYVTLSAPTIAHNQWHNYTFRWWKIDGQMVPECATMTLHMDGPKTAVVCYCEVFVDPPGDVNLDGEVTMRDIAIIVSHYGAKKDQPNYNFLSDVNHDGQIDLMDLVTTAKLLKI